MNAMTQEDLEQRLSMELHRRIVPPQSAPPALRQRIQAISTLQPVRPVGPWSGLLRLRPLGGLVAVGAALSLVVAALAWRGSLHGPGAVTTAMPGGVGQVFAADNLDGRFGWADVDRTLVVVTRDGGRTWSTRPMPATTGSHVYGIQFVDPDHGFAYAPAGVTVELGKARMSEALYRTIDGGSTWQRTDVSVTLAVPAAVSAGDIEWQSWWSLHFADRLNGHFFLQPRLSMVAPAADEAPSSLASTCVRFDTSDGGATWSAPQPSPCLAQLVFSDRSKPNLGLAVAADGSASSVRLLVTRDGGLTWQGASAPRPDSPGSAELVFWSLHLLESRSDGSLLAAVWWGPTELALNADLNLLGELQILSSSDGGASWSVLHATRQRQPSYFESLGDGHWISWVFDGPAESRSPDLWPNSGRLMVTADGGATWQRLAADGLPDGVEGLWFGSSAEGWAIALDTAVCGDARSTDARCGPDRVLMYGTDDGGSTWAPILTARDVPGWDATREPLPSGSSTGTTETTEVIVITPSPAASSSPRASRRCRPAR